MRLLLSSSASAYLLSVLLLLRWSPSVAAASDDTPPENLDPECTVASPHSENFFDLRPLRRLPDQTPQHNDWTAKGQDYGANFTINICAPVLADTASAIFPEDDPSARRNISAFYWRDGYQYSIGSTSTAPHFRGRKLVLAYENGSKCPDSEYRKSTLMSLMCDRELSKKPSIAFVGQFNDCSYFFEVRTAAACATVKQQAVGPVGIFGVIGLVAALVYCVGGCVYQRAVMHARGWRQIPHYHTWAAALGYIWESMKTAWTSFIEHLPLPSSFRGTSNGYSRGFGPRTIGGDRLTGIGGRGNSFDDENQLIDELDEDWGSD